MVLLAVYRIRLRRMGVTHRQPAVGLDLPLKLLIRERADGSAMVGYVSPAAIATRHGLPAELQARLQPVIELAAAAAGTT